MSPTKRLDFAFRLAHDRLNIDTLLDPEDVNTNCPDKKSIMMYVMCLFQSLPTEEDMKSIENEPPDIGHADVSFDSNYQYIIQTNNLSFIF